MGMAVSHCLKNSINNEVVFIKIGSNVGKVNTHLLKKFFFICQRLRVNAGECEREPERVWRGRLRHDHTTVLSPSLWAGFWAWCMFHVTAARFSPVIGRVGSGFLCMPLSHCAIGLVPFSLCS